MANAIILGPILRFQGVKQNRWYTSVLLVVEGGQAAPVFAVQAESGETPQANMVLLREYKGRYVWRVQWSVALSGMEQSVTYSIELGGSFQYVVPEIDKPLRMAYGSCFGFHNRNDMKKVKNKDAMWITLLKIHQQKPYHLLFMGGDQVYADLLWDTIPSLQEWSDRSFDERKHAPFTSVMKTGVEKFYFELYCNRWSNKRPAEVMSQIPTLMMWDDHDIFDGWGSYSEEQQGFPVFKGIYQIAREHFRTFQLQAKDDADLGDCFLFGKEGFSYAYVVGDLVLLTLDLRSERTQDQVMSLATWDRILGWIDQTLGQQDVDKSQKKYKHLLVMSSIPVVYINLNMIESVFGLIPGRQELEDDFKDQWLSRTHMGERLRLIHRLLKISKLSGCRITIVSGDVHMAALGHIDSDRDQMISKDARVINQLISSAMVNVPPPGFLIFMLEKFFSGKTEEIDRGITAQMQKFPGTSRTFIGARNWLSLTLDEQARIWAEWYVEGQKTPYTKVVHPIGEVTS